MCTGGRGCARSPTTLLLLCGGARRLRRCKSDKRYCSAGRDALLQIGRQRLRKDKHVRPRGWRAGDAGSEQGAGVGAARLLLHTQPLRQSRGASQRCKGTIP